jgi:glycogen(starch) synthase
MRILYITPSYPPKIGGGERYAQAIAQAAAAAGHVVTVVTTDIAENPDFWRWHPSRRHMPPVVSVEDGVTVLRCPAIGLRGGWTSLTLWRKAMVLLGSLGPRAAPMLRTMSQHIPTIPGLQGALSELGPQDLVHAYNLSWEYPMVLGWRLAQERGIPFVLTPFAHLGANVSSRVTRNITMPHQLEIVRQADAILALPSAEAQGLVALGVDAAQVYAVGSGYDAPPSAQSDANALQDILGPVVAFVGRVSRDKGALLAADAVRMLASESSPVPVLVLLGPVDDSFSRYYARLGQGERAYIRLLGPVSEADKHAILERSDLLVLPSRVDSFGIVLLEAWAHGKPVLGARAGGIPGVIDDGVDGLLVPWGDARSLAAAIRQILDDPEKARTMGEAGKRKTEMRYTWPAVYLQIERIYEDVMRRHKDRAPGPLEST